MTAAHRSKSTKINNLNTKCQTEVSTLYFQIVLFSQLFTNTLITGLLESQCCDVSVTRAAGGGKQPIAVQLTHLKSHAVLSGLQK